MIIQAYNNYSFNKYASPNIAKKQAPSFSGNFVQRLTHMNIGMQPAGFIGHVELKNATKGENVFVKVFKDFDCNLERYYFKDDLDRVIGEFSVKIKKAFNYDKIMYKEDPSHVYLDDLFNYSNPNTPFYKQGLDYYKGLGIRALQIAQRRSDEAQCIGNIKLNSMPEVRQCFYIDKIGMAPDPMYPYSGMLMLPPDKKEPLSKMLGGL